MEQLKAKLAVVTGASSGIGAAIVRDLIAAGLIVIGLARRYERMEALRQELSTDEQRARFHAIKCNIADGRDVAEVFTRIIRDHGPVYVLVNNAGCFRFGQLATMDECEVQEVLQTNVMGVVNCTRHVFAAMRAHSIDGHVILINSICGHKVPVISDAMPILNIYPATKFALTAINEIYRQEFKGLGTRVKVTDVELKLVVGNSLGSERFVYQRTGAAEICPVFELIMHSTNPKEALRKQICNTSIEYCTATHTHATTYKHIDK
ncbi:farnesol dehydrogenase isoform X1 [Zeugodacus cucurbitae]|uniref:farnesol dehydrogenase isoform X1 n=1 Tax=Zeugodacus cucurbitae TaxID=28588 RepID=UPI0023D916F7|nr:farnesol dehydrogenase isoform X1 [Zeugodacus cucurbitae]